MASKNMKRYSTSYVIKELEIKTKMRDQYNLIRWPKFKTPTTPNSGRMWGSWNSNSLLVGMQNGAAALEDSWAVSYETKRTLTT